MTRHTITNLIFVISLLALLLLSSYYPVSYGWYFLLAAIYFSVIALGSYFIGLQFFIYSYCQGNTAKPYIAITFDDGPKSPATFDILDILKSKNVSATFFCIGKNIAGSEATLDRINADGHLIGTHSFDHHWSFPLQRKKKIANEIVKAQKIVESVIHKRPLFFRPPFGVTDPPLAAAIKLSGVCSIGWSVRSYDTMISSPDKLLERISNIKNGDVILFHEDGLQTKVVLPLFIDFVRAKGLEIIPLDLLLGISAYEN